MNRIIRSRLICLALVLAISLVPMGCTLLLCLPCLLDCAQCFDYPVEYGSPELTFCALFCGLSDCTMVPFPCEIFPPNAVERNPTFEQMQIASIEYCEQYPEECQEAFEAYVDSFEEEAIE